MSEAGGQLSALFEPEPGEKPPDPRDLQTFVILSFEGPDPYARAGGLGARVSELSEALTDAGYETHVFFVGDPDLPGHEVLPGDLLHLHRWCQWISHYHRAGVYDGEEGKLSDWNESLAPWLASELIDVKLAAGGSVVVLAEEWQTALPVIQLADMARERGWHDAVHIFWNANHFFGFDRVDWSLLKEAAIVTTVSRFMRNSLALRDVEARVVPNGISETWFWPLDGREARSMARLFQGRMTLVKVARWDPDKGWEAAIMAVSELKKRGYRPLLLARGGHERYGRTLVRQMHGHRLKVGSATWLGNRPSDLMEAIAPVIEDDVILLDSFLSLEQRRLLFHSAGAVLANSSMEPFGLVGLETMAVGGVAFVGSTGEDYATAGHDAICIETSDPDEIVHEILHLNDTRPESRRLRERARRSAKRYSWPNVLKGRLLPLLRRSRRVSAHRRATAPAAAPATHQLEKQPLVGDQVAVSAPVPSALGAA